MSKTEQTKSRRCAVRAGSLSDEAMSELAAKIANDIAEDIDCRESRATLREVIRWWSLRSCIAHSELSLVKTDITVGRLALTYALPLIKQKRSGSARCARELGKIFLKANAMLSHEARIPKSMDTKPTQENPDSASLRSSDLLAGFSPLERAVILAQMEKTPVEKFNTISEQQWRSYRGCGRRFLERLKQRGWVEQVSEAGLSVRAQNVLCNANIEPTRENIHRALKDGRLSVDSKSKPRNYGLRTHNELLAFVGLPEQKRKARAWKFDPYTGRPLLG